MATPFTTPNVFASSFTLGAASTVGDSVDLPFKANYVRLYNYTAVDLYFDLLGNTPSTAMSHMVRACSEWGANVPPVQKIALHTTSTGAGGQVVRVLAMGI